MNCDSFSKNYQGMFSIIVLENQEQIHELYQIEIIYTILVSRITK